jgi:hypothetical protein
VSKTRLILSIIFYTWGVRSITNDELITGFSDIVQGCLKEGCGPLKLLHKRNAYEHTRIDAILYASDPFLYWNIFLSKYNIRHSYEAQYMRDYNREAIKLGIPTFLDADYLLLIIGMLCTFFILLDKHTCR